MGKRVIGGCMLGLFALIVVGIVVIFLFVRFTDGVRSDALKRVARDAAKPRILTNPEGQPIEAAVDRENFQKLLELGDATRFANEKPDSREDARDRSKSPKIAKFLIYARKVREARKKKDIIDISRGTNVEIIKSLNFPVTAMDSNSEIYVAGSQIRVKDGDLKGFEGWVLKKSVTIAPQ